MALGLPLKLQVCLLMRCGRWVHHGASQFWLVWGIWFIAVWLGCCCALLRLFDNNRFVGLPFFVLHATIWK